MSIRMYILRAAVFFFFFTLGPDDVYLRTIYYYISYIDIIAIIIGQIKVITLL